MRVGSLFSGVGLGDLGLMLAGMEIAWQVEIDDFCNEILELRWPDVQRWRDVKTVHGAAAHAEQHGPHGTAGQARTQEEHGEGGHVKSQGQNGCICPNCLPAVDLIIGGPPCQPFSLAGKRAGTTDDRYLWPEMSRIVRDVGPRWVVFENVPGVETVVESVVVPDLESLSYETWWLEIPAQALEACHRRMRVWVIGYAADEGLEGYERGMGRRSEQQERATVEQDDTDTASRRCKAGQERDSDETQDTADGNSWRRDADGQIAADAACNLRRASRNDGSQSSDGCCNPNWHRPPPEPTIRGVDARGTRCMERLKSLGNGMDVRSVSEIGRMIMEYDKSPTPTL